MVFRQLSTPEIARALELERGHALKGVGLEPDQSRIYPCGKLAAHLIGYTRREEPRAAEDFREFSYYVSDLVGVEGIERAFDRIPDSSDDTPQGLRGLPGYSLVEVNHLGFIKNRVISKIEPLHGNSVVLTVDSRAQRIAEQVIAGKRAALVVLDASNGDVLAAASSPSYNLSEGFTPFISGDYYKKLLKDP
ncbi:Peptidoglycan D,D-transpeptidase MrdA [bioreactor metagenome]|uniref:beta-lactamase n=1 Tax=bioreactor metagenome TaxID=1076179 RepID=A0A645GLG5_9ZZZZ